MDVLSAKLSADLRRNIRALVRGWGHALTLLKPCLHAFFVSDEARSAVRTQFCAAFAVQHLIGGTRLPTHLARRVDSCSPYAYKLHSSATVYRSPK